MAKQGLCLFLRRFPLLLGQSCFSHHPLPCLAPSQPTTLSPGDNSLAGAIQPTPTARAGREKTTLQRQLQRESLLRTVHHADMWALLSKCSPRSTRSAKATGNPLRGFSNLNSHQIWLKGRFWSLGLGQALRKSCCCRYSDLTVRSKVLELRCWNEMLRYEYVCVLSSLLVATFNWWEQMLHLIFSKRPRSDAGSYVFKKSK